MLKGQVATAQGHLGMHTDINLPFVLYKVTVLKTSASTSLALKKHKRQSGIAFFISFMNSYLNCWSNRAQAQGPKQERGSLPEKEG